jgi:dienelactone hydrolase
MELHITPLHGLVDGKLEIQLSGLEPLQPVSLSARVGAPQIESSAVYAADRNGCVDLSQQAPLSGSYDWVDPMGLLWTLKPREQKRMPLGSSAFSAESIAIHFTAEQGDDTASTTIERAWLREGVQRIPVDEDGLHGVLFMPTGEGPFPGVMVLTGSGGGANERTSALLANHGYAALALAYFAYPGRPDYLLEIELEYFQKGFQWLAAKPQVDGERLAVTGGSRGGELSLILGSTFPQIKAVVAYVPSGYRWGGLNDEGSSPVPAWTYQGLGLPFVRKEPQTIWETKYGPGDPIPLTPEFLAAVENAESLEEATIEVEKTNGAILLISGDEDAMWPSAIFSRQVIERLEKKQFAHPYKHLEYAGAGHGILMPYIPLEPADIVHPVNGGLYALGGTPQPMAHAIEVSWQGTLAFLQSNLQPGDHNIIQ